MPNVKGGKAYKKTKHGCGDDDAVFVEKEDDQMYARIVRNLGNQNMLVFCNDNKERIMRICGRMRKKIWLNVGDIVIICLRDFEAKECGKERGDIIAKVEPKHYSKIRKDDKVNEKLFINLENNRNSSVPDQTEDGYIMEHIDDEDECSSKSSDSKPKHVNNRHEINIIDDDLDIDNI